MSFLTLIVYLIAEFNIHLCSMHSLPTTWAPLDLLF